MKILILVPKKNFYCIDCIKEKGVFVKNVYPYIIYRYYRFFSSIIDKFKIDCYSFWKYKKYDKIIIFDIVIRSYPKILAYLITRYGKEKIYIYKWNNNLNQEELLTFKSVDLSHIYDYDLEESKKYGFRYNPIFYNEKYVAKFKKTQNFKYDVFYLGTNKNRVDKIQMISKILKDKNLKYKFYIIEKNKVNAQDENIIFLSKFVKYKKYIKMMLQSRCILDIPQDNQEGLSLRVMESLFFEKKLLTISDSYKKTNLKDSNAILNIFDESKNLLSFIFDQKSSIKDEVQLFYSFKEWIKRFDYD